MKKNKSAALTTVAMLALFAENGYEATSIKLIGAVYPLDEDELGDPQAEEAGELGGSGHGDERTARRGPGACYRPAPVTPVRPPRRRPRGPLARRRVRQRRPRPRPPGPAARWRRPA